MTEFAIGKAGLVTSFLQDLRNAMRPLLRRSAVPILLVVILALGITAATTMFSLVETVVLRPLPYFEPDRLVFLWTVDAKRGTVEDLASYPAFLDWKEQNNLFDDMARSLFLPAMADLNLTGDDDPSFVQGAKVTPNLFGVLGVHPILGRTFTEREAEDREGGVVISDWLWEQRFGRDSNIVNKVLEVDGTPRRIIGVMPSSFHFPSPDTQVWEPHTAFPQWPAKAHHTLFKPVVGRRTP